MTKPLDYIYEDDELYWIERGEDVEREGLRAQRREQRWIMAHHDDGATVGTKATQGGDHAIAGDDIERRAGLIEQQ